METKKTSKPKVNLKETEEAKIKKRKAFILGWIIRGIIILAIVLYMIFK